MLVRSNGPTSTDVVNAGLCVAQTGWEIATVSDFQWQYCAKATVEVKQILKKYPRDVRFLFRQFPLDIHSQAAVTAEASLAAQARGKFWERKSAKMRLVARWI